MSTPPEKCGTPWREEPPSGRVLLVTDNPISRAAQAIAVAAGHGAELVDDGIAAVGRLGPGPDDAVVICDHDAPDAQDVLRAALGSAAGYVAMIASRRRAAVVRAELAAEGVTGLERLHMPAGLDLGGRSAGEMALSIVAEIVADHHGHGGGPMRER